MIKFCEIMKLQIAKYLFILDWNLPIQNIDGIVENISC